MSSEDEKDADETNIDADVRDGVDEIQKSIPKSKLIEGGGAFSIEIDDLNTDYGFAYGLISCVDQMTVQNEEQDKPNEPIDSLG